MDYSCFLENQGLYDCNLYGIVSYLISLFYRTNCKFECSRRKINRLLTIYKLCCDKNGYDCFEDKFYIGEPYSYVLGINFIPREVYCRYFYDEYDENSLFFECILKEDDVSCIENMPFMYKQFIKGIKISEESKKLLEDVFKKFGGFKFQKMANDIDEIMENIPTIKMLDIMEHIDKDKINDFFEDKNNNQIYKNNIVFQFVKNYNIDKNMDFKDEKYFNCDKVDDWFFKKFQNLSFENQKKLLQYIDIFFENEINIEEQSKQYFIDPRLPK